MVLSIPVEKIKGHHNGILASSSSVNMVVAAEKAIEIKVINTDEVSFYYPLNGTDSKTSLSYLEADEEVADMLTAADMTASPYDRSSEAFDILDKTGGTATSTVIPWSDFLFAITADASAGESWMWYSVGSKVKKVLVDHTLAEIVALATP